MMRVFWFVLALVFGAPALAAPPSDASLQELMKITDAKRMVEGALEQMDSMMQGSIERALRSNQLSPDAQKAMGGMKTKVTALVKEEMDWSKWEPILTESYRETLTQEEVDGMLKFYKSDAGQAVIAKMPVVMKKNADAIQQRMMKLMTKMQELQQEVMKQAAPIKTQ